MNKDPLSIEFSCPIPEEQQPCNEYRELKESLFYSWPQLSFWEYSKKLLWLVFWGCFLIIPITAAGFPLSKQPLYFFLSSVIAITLLLSLTILRLYLAWLYIGDRLKSRIIFYEESGWYDGQKWQKPEVILERDLLIFSYQIEPVLRRLKNTAGLLIIIMMGSSTIWLILSKLSTKP